MEVIDKVLGEGMAYAEKKCRKIRDGEVPFSEKLVKAGHHIKLWWLVLRHKTTNDVHTCMIRRASKRCNLTSVLSVSLPTAQQNLATAWTNYNKLKKLHTVFAMSFYVSGKTTLNQRKLNK